MESCEAETGVISVIVPMYNAEKYIARAIESIKAQTTNAWELLLIDDGSTDRTAEIGEKYAAEDTRIRLIRNPKGGVSRARNRGLAEARGVWVAFLDADDYYLHDGLRLLRKAAEDIGADWVAGSREVCRMDGTTWRKQWTNAYEGDILRDANGWVLKRKRNLRRIYEVWGGVYRRSLLERYAIRFDETLKLGEDLLFNTRVACHARRMVQLHEVVYGYVRNEGSVIFRLRKDQERLMRENYEMAYRLRAMKQLPEVAGNRRAKKRIEDCVRSRLWENVKRPYRWMSPRAWGAAWQIHREMWQPREMKMDLYLHLGRLVYKVKYLWKRYVRRDGRVRYEGE